ncbi:MAG: TonB-dependent receptor, partial [Gammaproteobacteria bacterium]|nr:TonB-dependent receptor [Gammaproteobacteria bacterium]
RLTALFAPNAAWTFTGAVDYFSDAGTGNLALMQNPRPGQKRFSALVDTAGFLDQENLAYRLRADFRPTDAFEVSYIGGWAKLTRSNDSDNDAGAIPGFKQEHRTEGSRFESYSHELAVKSSGDSNFQWIAGAFLMHEDNAIRFDIDFSRVAPPADLTQPIVVNPSMPADTAWALSFVQPQRTLDSQAAFAQGTLGLTGSLRVTAGARYTEEEKEDSGGRNFVCPDFNATIAQGGRLLGRGGAITPDNCRVFGVNDGKTKDDKVTWLGRLEYDFNPDLLSYVSVSTGFKSGGLSDGGRRHLPEELTNYELGLKSELIKNVLTLNVSAFFMDYQDMQVSAVERLPSGQQQLVTSNAASASIKGVEAEFVWRPTPNDSLSGFASVLDAQFDEFRTIDTTFSIKETSATPWIWQASPCGMRRTSLSPARTSIGSRCPGVVRWCRGSVCTTKRKPSSLPSMTSPQSSIRGQVPRKPTRRRIWVCAMSRRRGIGLSKHSCKTWKTRT